MNARLLCGPSSVAVLQVHVSDEGRAGFEAEGVSLGGRQGGEARYYPRTTCGPTGAGEGFRHGPLCCVVVEGQLRACERKKNATVSTTQTDTSPQKAAAMPDKSMCV